MSAGQFGRRTFSTTAGAATTGAIVAVGLPIPARAAPADSADSADAVGFGSDGNPLNQVANLIGSTTQQSTSS